MKNKRKDYKSGSSVTMEKLFPSGMYLIELRTPKGELHDKIRVDDYRMALDYWRSFCAIAKNMKEGV